MSCCEKNKVPERRGFPRLMLNTLGSAVAIAGPRSVIVEDLSGTGARLRGKDLPAEGRELLIRFDGRELFGKIVWSGFNLRGVSFDHC
jgi:hypothetical protein